jgi:hypothetical protein
VEYETSKQKQVHFASAKEASKAQTRVQGRQQRWTGWNARDAALRRNLDQQALGQHRAPPILTILDIDFGVKSVSGRLLEPTARFCHGFNMV